MWCLHRYTISWWDRISWWRHDMKTLSAFQDLFAEKPLVAGHRWIPLTQGMFSLMSAYTNWWINSREAGDLRRPDSCYVTIMWIQILLWNHIHSSDYHFRWKNMISYIKMFRISSAQLHCPTFINAITLLISNSARKCSDRWYKIYLLCHQYIRN